MTERSILLSAWEIRAVLAGRCSQIRRIAAAHEPEEHAGNWQATTNPDGDVHWLMRTKDVHGNPIGGTDAMGLELGRCRHGRVGETVWVREPFQVIWNEDGPCGCDDDDARARPFCSDHEHLEYKADTGARFPGGWPDCNADDPECPRWRPATKMPRWACRLVLQVNAVRVERLHAITEADAIASGVKHFPDIPRDPVDETGFGPSPRWSAFDPKSTAECLGTARYAYGNAWCRAYAGENWNLRPGPSPWDQNPWVWVVSFERVGDHVAVAASGGGT